MTSERGTTRKRSSGPAPKVSAPKASTLGASGREALDPDVAEVMRLSADLQRASTRQLRALWREKKLSERGLFMLELIQAGLNRPSRLIEYFDVLPSTITFETDKLVAAGLLVRATDPVDRRAVRLSLTEEGCRVHREVTAAVNALLRGRLDGLAPGEFDTFVSIFCKVLPPPE